MGKSLYSTVIAVDPRETAIHFYSTSGNDKSSISHEIKKYHGKTFDEEFYKKFTGFLEEHSIQYPAALTAVTLVLPDNVVATDLISVPNMRKSKMSHALDVAIGGVYKNYSDLVVNTALVNQNKQYRTYGLSIIRKDILSAFAAAFSSVKITQYTITYASNTLINAVESINSKLRSESFMFLDIKSDFTRIALVSRGRTAGFYSLPFGYSMLYKTRLAAEDMLFEHEVAELAVQTAKEKAKAKQNTMMKNDSAAQLAKSLDEDAGGEESPDENGENEGQTGETIPDPLTDSPVYRTATKKQPRKLPSYLLPPEPHNDREYICTNFRIFVKWALNLIQANEKSVYSEPVNGVYVNIPEEYDFVFENVNESEAENGVRFTRFDCGGEPETVSNNLELYGGMYTGQYNPTNNF